MNDSIDARRDAGNFWEIRADALEALFPEGVPTALGETRSALTTLGTPEAIRFLTQPETVQWGIYLTAMIRRREIEVGHTLILGQPRAGKSAMFPALDPAAPGSGDDRLG